MEEDGAEKYKKSNLQSETSVSDGPSSPENIERPSDDELIDIKSRHERTYDCETKDTLGRKQQKDHFKKTRSNKPRRRYEKDEYHYKPQEISEEDLKHNDIFRDSENKYIQQNKDKLINEDKNSVFNEEYHQKRATGVRLRQAQLEKAAGKELPQEYCKDGRRKWARTITGSVEKRLGRRPVVDMTNWRKKMDPTKIMFDDIKKGEYLVSLAENNCHRTLAARMVGVSRQVVTDHKEIDPDFSQACDEVERAHSEKIVNQLEGEFLAGYTHPMYNTKTGEHLGDKQFYETPARIAMLKRFSADYRDSAQGEGGGGGMGGVLIAPADSNPVDWVQQQQLANESKLNPIIDITPDAQDVNIKQQDSPGLSVEAEG